MKIELYSASFCSNCDTLKKIFNEINIDYDIIDIDTPEGGAKAQANRVRSLPSVCLIKPDMSVTTIVGVKDKIFWLNLMSELELYG